MLVNGLTNLPRRQIRSILIATDCTLVLLSTAFAYRLTSSRTFSELGAPTLLASVFLILAVSVGVFAYFRLYRIKLSLLNSSDLLAIIKSAFTLSMLAFLGVTAVGEPSASLFALLFGLNFFTMTIMSRVSAIFMLRHLRELSRRRVPVAIFGAGSKGVTIANALLHQTQERLVQFYDDNLTMDGMVIGGIPVSAPTRMFEDLKAKGIKHLIIALPDRGNAREQTLVAQCQLHDIDVRVVPSITDVLAAKKLDGKLKSVYPLDVLGRDKVEFDTPEIARSYAGRIILVTGAGGSIGSEVCRQLLSCHPARIVLFDHSEYNLYRISRELLDHPGAEDVEIVSLLGSVTDAKRVTTVIDTHLVEIVIHAAAYKHVPLVEQNELEAARNNVQGTKIVAQAALDAKVERFILISTDKAVRPTSVMGGTKRMAEMVVQDIQSRSDRTLFSIVRFGNVLGSSGSVLPLFTEQIAAGGPVTVTHPAVTRYFMTAHEATRLVLLAGALAKGGDVFVLEMGKPQNILQIAKRMIELSGLQEKNSATGEGDIAIEITGLRPGEKLFEEKLIDSASLRRTPHPKILRAKEAFPSQFEVAAMLREIQESLENVNENHLREIIRERVLESNPARRVRKQGT